MNTLKMVKELRNNTKLKAECELEDFILKVKCVNGNIVGELNTPLKMTDSVLSLDDWILVEENAIVEVYGTKNINLKNGIGELPEDKEIIGDIDVLTSNGFIHTIRPIGKKFALPTNDKIVHIVFKYKGIGTKYINIVNKNKMETYNDI